MGYRNREQAKAYKWNVLDLKQQFGETP